MKFLLIAIEVIVGLLLIGVVLLQRSKDQGLGLAFGAGMGESLFGSQAVNVLIKITVILSCVFFLNTMILARMMRSQATSVRAVPLQEQRRGGI
ncbi:MAG: preprotein translocase subunit SecG, partial [bacterium]